MHGTGPFPFSKTWCWPITPPFAGSHRAGAAVPWAVRAERPGLDQAVRWPGGGTGGKVVADPWPTGSGGERLLRDAAGGLGGFCPGLASSPSLSPRDLPGDGARLARELTARPPPTAARAPAVAAAPCPLVSKPRGSGWLRRGDATNLPGFMPARVRRPLLSLLAGQGVRLLPAEHSDWRPFRFFPTFYNFNIKVIRSHCKRAKNTGAHEGVTGFLCLSQSRLSSPSRPRSKSGVGRFRPRSLCSLMTADRCTRTRFFESCENCSFCPLTRGRCFSGVSTGVAFVLQGDWETARGPGLGEMRRAGASSSERSCASSRAGARKFVSGQ